MKGYAENDGYMRLGMNQIFCNKQFQVPIHYSLNIAGFRIGTVVLDHGIGMKYIRANLATPFNLFHFALDFCVFLRNFTFFQFDELDRKSTRLNSSHLKLSRMPSSA